MTLPAAPRLYGGRSTAKRLGSLIGGAVLALVLIAPGLTAPDRPGDTGWSAYGGDERGQRYSAATQITPANVNRLEIAWSYSTGDLTARPDALKRASFENTPILAEGKLFLCSPFDEVAALDPGTGKQLWRFNPKLDTKIRYPNDFVCRGVTYWRSTAAQGLCSTRIFVGTNDRRLIALDAKSGKPCPRFGNNGTVVIAPEGKLVRKGQMQITSAPVVSHGVVVIGSSIDDNQRVDELRGTVHAFDAETGKPKWSFDPLGAEKSPFRAGAANVWAPMSIDEQRGLVFLPTSSASPDFFGSKRIGDGKYANSVVALKIETGEVAWSFQTTHHDVWDYDIPAQPTLGIVNYQGKPQPAVIQATKQGLLFTLNRDTGLPIIPVEERKVPQGGEIGEQLSPTQPFPIAPRPLAANKIKPGDAYGITFWDRGACEKMIGDARSEGLYTPPSTKGTIVYPFTGGGTNWGGIAFDEKNNIVYVNTSNAMHLITLIPAKKVESEQERFDDVEISAQEGAPYGMRREVLLSPLGIPCNPTPWGQLHAIDMRTGKVLWDVPLGSTEDLVPFSEYFLGKTGSPNIGGPMVTASGLVFIGATMDNYLRAFDAKTGKELWKGRLPAGGQATPMTYVWKGKQYVLIASGGHSKLGTKRGDQLVAFALPN